MDWLRELARRIRMLMNRRQFDAALEEEMRLHLALRQPHQLESGMTADEAQAAARRRFGNVTSLRERSNMAWGWKWLEYLTQDIRFGLRILSKNPGVTIVIIVTLALGVGANTAIFGLVNGLLLQRLPVPAPEQIAALVIQSADSSLGALGFSYPQFVEFREQAAPICEVFGSATAWRLNFTAEGHSDTLTIAGVSSNYFSALGVKPALGRLVLPGEGEHPGEPAILVLSYGLWQRRFGGDPHVIGKQVRVDGKSATIVGVMEKEFHGQFTVFEMDAYAPF